MRLSARLVAARQLFRHDFSNPKTGNLFFFSRKDLQDMAALAADEDCHIDGSGLPTLFHQIVTAINAAIAELNAHEGRRVVGSDAQHFGTRRHGLKYRDQT